VTERIKYLAMHSYYALLCRSILLRDHIAQPLAVFLVANGEDSRATLRQPSGAHRSFKRPTLAIDRPSPVIDGGEMAEVASAKAAAESQPRTSGGRPIKHLNFEIVCFP
jgi:hypothetical protein